MKILNAVRRSFCSSIKPNITFDKLKTKVIENNVQSIYLGFPDMYGRFASVKINPETFIDETAGSGITVNSDVFNSDIQGNKINPNLKSKPLILKPDLHSIREMSWMKSKSFMVMGDLYDPTTNNLYEFAPRSVLKRQIEELKKNHFKLIGASELEFFLFEKKYAENKKNSLRKIEEFGSHYEDYLLQQGDRYEHILEKFRNCLNKSGIPVETSKGEASIGQHEINVMYSEALEMSDRVLALKLCLKHICEEENTTCTFMAKPYSTHLGSSSHLHVSLHQLDGKNVFQGKDKQLNEEISCSNTMVNFLGGIMNNSLDTFICFAPIVNSYKRYKNFSWAPSNLGTWSIDNRTAPFRIVGKDKNLRIEYRIPGGDVNQYICYSALISSGLNGILNKINPPEIQKGSSYDLKEIVRPPSDIHSASTLFSNSQLLRKAFGEEVHKHYSDFYFNESKEFEKTVTDWELKRYLDLI